MSRAQGTEYGILTNKRRCVVGVSRGAPAVEVDGVFSDVRLFHQALCTPLETEMAIGQENAAGPAQKRWAGG